MSRRLCVLFVSWLCVAGFCKGISAADDAATRPLIPDLKVERYRLPNGLEVILHVDRSTPITGVNLFYKVGSKNEAKGRTGFAHLFEHLMFQGSKHHDDEYFGPLEKGGAQINGSTNTDRTNYFETVPSNYLELALFMESDRMGYLLPALTQKKLDNQRDVVKNERRQRVDNVPYGQSMERLLEALYPDDHPYHHSVIGSMADLSAASLADVSAFFQTYYAPNNASLCIAGDFDVDTAKLLVTKYFGSIPQGPEVPRLEPRPATIESPKHIRMTDRVALGRTSLVWAGVHRGHGDEPALDVLASILGGLEKENRLYKALMYDRSLASSVNASDDAGELSGTFEIEITAAKPGTKLDDLVAIADAEIARVKTEGPTEGEVLNAKRTMESRMIQSIQAIGRRANFLNQNNVERGDPLAYKEELTKLFAVTPADVRAAADKYLTEKRIRLDVTSGAPTPRAPEAVVDRSKQVPSVVLPAQPVVDPVDRSKLPEPGPVPKFEVPKVVRKKLSNGLDVLILERHELPVLTFHLTAKGGETLTPRGKEGLAGIAASLLEEGTNAHDSLALAAKLNRLGATTSASADLESCDLAMSVPSPQSAAALDLFAEILTSPAFPEKALERRRTRRLSMLLRLADNANGIASIVFPKLVYGADHPYGRPERGTKTSVPAITREDIVDFYKKVFAPNNSALIIVGDASADEITVRLEKALAGWKPSASAAAIAIPAPEKVDRRGFVYLVDKPAAAQSVLAVGQVGAPRKTPDYFALTILNAVLGGQFSSRINLNLREEKGYTYGARSQFDFLVGPGPFKVQTAVQTAVTKEALFELMKELHDVVGSRPVTDAELEFAKDRAVKSFPVKFETTTAAASALKDVVLYGLSDDYYRTYQAMIERVTKADVAKASKEHLDPDQMTILVVGDRSKIESGLRSLPFVKKIVSLDTEGAPAGESSTGEKGAIKP